MHKTAKTILALLTITIFCACQQNPKEAMAIENAERMIVHNPDSAQTILNQINPQGNNELHASWAALKVWAAYRCYQPDINEQDLQTAFNYFAHRGIKNRKALVYYLRAVVHEEKNIGDEADWMEDLRRGCTEVESTDDHFLAAQLFHRYGIGLQKRKRYDEAGAFLNKFMTRAEQAGNKSDIIIAHINLSNLSLERNRKKGEYEEAIAYAQKAVEKARGWKMPGELGKASGQLSICCGHNKQFDEALQYAIQAKDIDEHQYNTGKRKEPVRYTRIADAHRKLGNADSAIYYATKNLKHPELTIRMNGIQLLYMINRDLIQDYQKSTRYMEIFQLMKDSLATKLKSEQVIRREMDSESAEALESQKTGYNYLLLSIAIVVILLAILVTVYRLRLKRQKRLLSESATVIQEQQAHEQLLTEEIVNSNKLISDLHESPHFLSQSNWDMLYSVAEKAYPDFLSSLKKQFADLTDVDVQVALLIRLHFSGSQIATMMAVSPSSVTKQKQRMKKRMAKSNPTLFQAEMSLDSFIQSL